MQISEKYKLHFPKNTHTQKEQTFSVEDILSWWCHISQSPTTVWVWLRQYAQCLSLSYCLSQTVQPYFQPGLKDYSPVQDTHHTPPPVFHSNPLPETPNQPPVSLLATAHPIIPPHSTFIPYFLLSSKHASGLTGKRDSSINAAVVSFHVTHRCRQSYVIFPTLTPHCNTAGFIAEWTLESQQAGCWGGDAEGCTHSTMGLWWQFHAKFAQSLHSN